MHGGVCIERMRIQISCLQEDCDGNMSIPFSLGNTIPQIPLMCFKCNSSLMIVTKFDTHDQSSIYNIEAPDLELPANGSLD